MNNSKNSKDSFYFKFHRNVMKVLMLVSYLLFMLHCVFIYIFVVVFYYSEDQTVNFIKFFFVPSQSDLEFLLFWSINVLKFICWSNVESLYSLKITFLVRVCYSVNILLDFMTNIIFGLFWHQFSLMVLLCGFLFLCVL